jgi:NAD(P)H dehydrogenase (quinone)
MIITVIGATGRVGSAVVQRLVTANAAVRVLVRDPGKARRLFGDSPHLETIRIHLDDPAAVAAGLTGSDAVFLAMGSIGLQASLQRIVIQAAAATPGLRQLVRLSVLNARPDSLGINQRAHWTLDFAAQVAGVPYTTIRPAIFSASILAGAPEIKASRTWTGLASTGRVALSDHRDTADAAVRVLTEPSTWGQHHDLTGPRQLSWPEALQALSAELGETVTFRTHQRHRTDPATHAGRGNIWGGGTAGDAGMGDHSQGERANHQHGAGADRPRAAYHRGILPPEPRTVSLNCCYQPLSRRLLTKPWG